MGLALFYQLTRSPVEDTAALLLGKAVAAGWRVMLRGTDAARLAMLDEKLWGGAEDGFLPHGLEGGPHDAAQPVLLGLGPIANAANCLMTVDGAAVALDEAARLDRIWVLFDGNSDAALATARVQWKALAGVIDGVKAQYWSEVDGRWQMKAER
ncbi:DNA polymerase III subunit chi [Paracoccaceae bacterium Fryx2]|nr:DNA polymerase III subunit chi [Paracoccaceae bacterium Fryx2]